VRSAGIALVLSCLYMSRTLVEFAQRDPDLAYYYIREAYMTSYVRGQQHAYISIAYLVNISVSRYKRDCVKEDTHQLRSCFFFK